MKNEFSKQQQEQAERLRNQLASGEPCQDADLKPFMETGDALKREASTADSKLDPGVARIQRAMLLNMAKHKPSSVPKPETRKSKSWFSFLTVRPLATGFALVAAVFLFAFIAQLNVSEKQSSLPLNLPYAAREISRLVIPEAHAGDAFSMKPEQADAAGADPSTAFILESQVEIDTKTLEQHLQLIPAMAVDGTSTAAVPVEVEKTGTGTFRVKPAVALDAGKVYQIALATSVQKDNGEVQNRDFTWAIQTKQIFKVLSTVPALDSSYVPTNTGIEFLMSLPGWEDPSAFFSIEPKVPGKFETHGRSLVFLPSKSLAPGQLYIVTLKKGFKVKGSDRALEQDVIVRFETSPEGASGIGRPQLAQFIPNQRLVTTAPQKEVVIPGWWSNEATDQNLSVTGYRLSLEEAKAALEAEGQIPDFAEVTRRKGEVFQTYAKNQAFEVEAKIEKANYIDLLRLPGVADGHYVVKLQPKTGAASWFYLEATRVASYVVADKDQTLVWTMNIETGFPFEKMNVAYDTVSAKTDSNGIAKIPTPKELATTSTAGSKVLTLGEGEQTSLVRVQAGGPWMPFWYGRTTPSTQTVAYLQADRPIYRTSDKASLFGVAQDRDSKQRADEVTVELQRQNFIDFLGTGSQKVYRRTTVETDEKGFFRSALDWSNLSPGYYTLVLKSRGLELTSRSFEVRDYVKPAYNIDLTVEKQAVYAGDTVDGQVRVAFFDGTPIGNLELNLVSEGVTHQELKVTTDENGLASFHIPTQIRPCSIQEKDVYCGSVDALSLTARPVDSEESDIYGSTNVTVWASHVSLELDTKTDKDKATLNVTLRRVDLARAIRSADDVNVLAEPIRGARVTGRLIERTWEKKEEGTTYDFIEKKIVPSYRYEMVERDVAPIDMLTDAQGKASFPYTMSKKDVSYRAVVTVKDEKGADEVAQAYFAYDGFGADNRQNPTEITFEATTPQENRTGYHVGEKIDLGFFKGGEPLPDTDRISYLYVESQRGIRQVNALKTATYQLSFDEEDVPNVMLRGVAFLNGGFVERTFTAALDSQDRALNISVTPDQASYTPAGKAKIHVTAKKKDGSAAAAARVSVSLVDEALFAIVAQEEYPLNSLYAYVADGVLFTQESHYANAIEAQSMRGGAEMGGGGGADVVRRNFKDTAAFETLVLDRKGEGDLEVTLPDNVTGWRVSAVAITSDLYGGYTRTTLPVTKPVFVDAVIPSVLLASDQPILKLRAFGTGLKDQEELSYVVNAPTLGLKEEKVSGTAGKSTYVKVPQLTPGEHTVTLRVTAAGKTDAIEKKVTVTTSRFLRNQFTQTELVPGTTLPDPGASREVDVTFLPKTRAQYLGELHTLADAWSERVEAKYAAYFATKLLQEYFQEEPSETPLTLTRYQRSAGGIAILPYASEEVELSSKIAAVNADVFDKNALAKYFWDVLQKRDVTREEQARALSGLAALGEPVLAQLQTFSQTKDLSWREELAVTRGLAAAGDQEGARSLLERLLKRAEERDGQMFIRVSDDRRSIIEATAEAASVAIALSHPSASKLDAWVQANWGDDAFTDLDRIGYLLRAVPATPGRDVTLSYSVDGSTEHTIELKEGNSHTETLTADEVKQFRATKVDGPVVAVFTREVTRLPEVPSSDISLERTFAKADGSSIADLKEGDVVRVTLTPRFKGKAAPQGCYLVRDHLAAGVAPLISLYFTPYGDFHDVYPTESVDGHINFISCESGKPISYRARIVARGNYTAESAILQSLNTPSVSALTPSNQIEIK
jgi:alpha-2-macroglobulin